MPPRRLFYKQITRRVRAFTLSELLIVLTVLGIVATFSIPKILTAQNNAKYNAMAKEAASMISQAYNLYQTTTTVTSTFNGTQLVPYLNYIKQDTTSVYQDNENSSPYTISCATTGYNCYQTATGGIVNLFSGNQMGGVSATNFIWIDYDPDGSGPAYDISFMLFYNGRIATEGEGSGSTYWGGLSSFASCPGCEPSWWKHWK